MKFKQSIKSQVYENRPLEAVVVTTKFFRQAAIIYCENSNLSWSGKSQFSERQLLILPEYMTLDTAGGFVELD